MLAWWCGFSGDALVVGFYHFKAHAQVQCLNNPVALTNTQLRSTAFKRAPMLVMAHLDVHQAVPRRDASLACAGVEVGPEVNGQYTAPSLLLTQPADRPTGSHILPFYTLHYGGASQRFSGKLGTPKPVR